MRIMVTGGRGFIGSHFVEKALKYNNVLSIIDYDCMTYAASQSLPFDDNPKYEHINKRIQDIERLPPNIDYIVNFAAESHVDNSIASPSVFIESNVLGVYNLLELIRGKVYSRPQFIQISTDEVYGDADDGDSHFNENHKLTPSNPYAGSKAAAEMMIMSYGRTFDIDYKITRSTNNYGPRQYPEKLIPKCIDSIESEKKYRFTETVAMLGTGFMWKTMLREFGMLLNMVKIGTYTILAETTLCQMLMLLSGFALGLA